ncbi:MAG TPA: MlaD family protein [Verrucomicrobiae bacterium]|jgi:phospholipid/cholesterol/gamma-HCH transport system substrate-binding protein|nr:MlaD family protein [Verrucomicrobiae bacterium]
MNKQAQVGLFAVFAMLLLFGVFYVITDFGTRHNGYRIGIHFTSAAGLSTGALVYFSGVTVGTVDSIVLQPDNTVSVILAVNKEVDIPTHSKFLIQAPLTGSPAMVIVPPLPGQRREDETNLAREVLPVSEQAQGTDSATVADLLEQGQGEVRRMDKVLADIETREPKLLDTVQATLLNANRSVSMLSAQAASIAASLQSSLSVASANIVDLTGSLDKTVGGNTSRINAIMTQLDQTSRSLNASSHSLQQLATNPDLHTSIVATAKNIQDTTQTIAELTQDIRTLTGNPQTQAQLRDTVANVDAASQRATSLLGNFGGASNVYGVDAGATPAPSIPGASPYPAEPYPDVSPVPNSISATNAINRAKLKGQLGGVLRNLVAIQLRLSSLDNQRACCANPLLSADRGPQTDINAIFLPERGTSVVLGANDIGYRTTANAYVMQSYGGGVRLGGGIMYSRLGLVGQYNARAFGLEGMLYDLRYPTLDLYGRLNITHGASFFVGQRDVTHAERRSVYGLQLQF